MNLTEICNNIKLITNIEDNTKINLFASKAYRKLKSLIEIDEKAEINFKDDINDIVEEMAIYFMNVAPRYGIKTERLMEFSFSYSSLPQDILDDINALSVKINGVVTKEYSAKTATAFNGW